MRRPDPFSYVIFVSSRLFLASGVVLILIGGLLADAWFVGAQPDGWIVQHLRQAGLLVGACIIASLVITMRGLRQ